MVSWLKENVRLLVVEKYLIFVLTLSFWMFSRFHGSFVLCHDMFLGAVNVFSFSILWIITFSKYQAILFVGQNFTLELNLHPYAQKSG